MWAQKIQPFMTLHHGASASYLCRSQPTCSQPVCYAMKVGVCDCYALVGRPRLTYLPLTPCDEAAGAGAGAGEPPRRSRMSPPAAAAANAAAAGVAAAALLGATTAPAPPSRSSKASLGADAALLAAGSPAGQKVRSGQAQGQNMVGNAGPLLKLSPAPAHKQHQEIASSKNPTHSTHPGPQAGRLQPLLHLVLPLALQPRWLRQCWAPPP